MHFLVIFIGGGLGSLCRYFISYTINQSINSIFPSGTFSVNLIGSFLMGFLFNLFENFVVPVETKIFFTIGFLGGFTTFSSFSIETINLLREGEYKYFLLNIILTNILCLSSTIAGIYCFKMIKKLIGR